MDEEETKLEKVCYWCEGAIPSGNDYRRTFEHCSGARNIEKVKYIHPVCDDKRTEEHRNKLLANSGGQKNDAPQDIDNITGNR